MQTLQKKSFKWNQFCLAALTEIKNKVTKKLNKSNGNSIINGFQIKIFNDDNKVTNSFDEEITRIKGDIPIDLDISKGSRFLFISFDQSKFSNGIHKYPAKFFPELPRWVIKRFSKEQDLVLDPFTGSGTTNVEALLLKRHSTGIDVDPFARFLTKVKVTPLDSAELIFFQKKLLKLALDYHPSKVKDKDIPKFPYMEQWFKGGITLELAYLIKSIEALDCNQEIRNFYKVCFSSIIRSVSNADDNCTRTVIRERLNKQVNPCDALKKFAEAILINVPRMIEFSNIVPKKIKVIIPNDMDARNMNLKTGTVDLAVTSPPYVNAVDYPRTHQLESYWLGLANGSLAQLKKEHIGTESVSVREYCKLHKIGIDEADAVIKLIFLQDPRRAYIAYKYLYDMKQNLIETYRVLKKGGNYIIVVGNNRIRNHLFENWKYIKSLAEIIGFKVETYFASEIIRHFIKVPREERINTDWVLVLRK